VFGERDREHPIFRESLDRLRAEHGNVTVDYVLSGAGEAWNGRVGHVQDHLPDALDGLDGTGFYLCGLPEMVVETRELLEGEGVDEDHVYTEGWESDAAGGEVGTDVSTSGREGSLLCCRESTRGSGAPPTR
jgi:NAD(P)H-flavin reductase